jgi:UDP-N-acetylmuramoylalanine--D-glutamate ligase
MSGRGRLVRKGDRVSVLGLGVSGEAAALLAASLGARVYASDIKAGNGQEATAARLRDEGVEAEVGCHDMDRILASDLVVVSPGISPSSEVRHEVSIAGIPTVAEVELAYSRLGSRVIGVTGTNGKTTTTVLIGHLLRESGLTVETAGNVGRALSEVALSVNQPEWAVVELSSFQLADIENFATHIGVLLNLAPDHLDRYRDVTSYYGDKRRMFGTGTDGSRWVLNADDDEVMRLAADAPGTTYLFSLDGPVGEGAWLDAEDRLVARIDGESHRWAAADELLLLGRHNVANALAAGLVAALAGCSDEDIARGLRSFQPLEHRLEPLGTLNGALWVNDSKATNISATGVALDAFDCPVVLLLGGRHKGEPYSSIANQVAARVRAIVAFGEAAPRIVADLEGVVPILEVENGLEATARCAARTAEPGDVVLLSPACSSYDMFPNYRERGRVFRKAFEALRDLARSAS